MTTQKLTPETVADALRKTRGVFVSKEMSLVRQAARRHLKAMTHTKRYITSDKSWVGGMDA